MQWERRGVEGVCALKFFFCKKKKREKDRRARVDGKSFLVGKKSRGMRGLIPEGLHYGAFFFFFFF